MAQPRTLGMVREVAKRRVYLENSTHSDFLFGLAQDIDSQSGRLVRWGDYSTEQVKEIEIRLMRISELLKGVGG